MDSLLERGLPVENSTMVGKLLSLRVLYKLQQGNTNGALDNLFDLMKFQIRNNLFPRTFIEFLINNGSFENSLYILRLILNDGNLSSDEYVKLLDFFDNFKPNFIEWWKNGLKFSFYLDVKMMDSMVNYVDADKLSRSKFNFQPNRTTNGFASYFRKMISDPFYSNDADLLKLSKKYNGNILMLYLTPNSYGEVLMVSFLNYSAGCKVLSTSFDLDSLRLLIAIKLYEIKNNKTPASLDNMVPAYFKDLDWLNFNNERIVDYSSKVRGIYSNLLEKNCKMQKSVDLLK